MVLRRKDFDRETSTKHLNQNHLSRNKIHQGDRVDIQSSAKQYKHACTLSRWVTK